MASHLVAKTTDFVDLKPFFTEVDSMTVAVYRFDGRYHAYANWCPHQGGPATEGIIVRLEAGGGLGGRAPRDRYCISCPWHGIEFDLQSGVCLADPRMRIKSYQVVVDGDKVLVG